ncbi:DUF551 domain-containing protein [Escherichia coli]|uniref:DUF551 domain-containing protein n=1 Tax=Escherichia coli TaxID=562 RepID=UPI0002C9222B|nr:hypothetical protein EC2875000_2597 [Escherichia coli 2875000]EMV71102.1 hypothetical protein EC2866550_2810 [Escherichia coli 2866550]EMV72399.1 hypothetical protein EC2866450_2660 [Escherichia coli 2866450]EMW02025.1 hypothetical protein EC2853500_2814 [Escherichia coli 2853500]EMW02184.1 hypothetical protein EC2851500_2596 [Escherichia coli 2851500]EMW07750.1 hypothetical protein EC2850750_2664 [Escherichia coli 2850750]EMW23114.1 hypothetical protein EC2850400_0865 [Escherichia coli 28
MAELTKEWLKQTIAQYEANRDELPFGLDTNSAIELQAFKLALASLEAEPVAYIFKHPAGKLFWALTDESNKEQSDVIPVYAAPPVPVVPAALPENDDEDGHDIDYLEPSEVYSLGRTAGWNACRAAMLHGAEPVSQTYKLPPLSSREVNDAAWKLHNMLTEHGPLNGCQFNNLKECFYEALKVAMRNYPVTPDGWISCSERMPNDKQYVWCWGKSYGWTECNTFEGYYDWSRNKWWAVTDDGEEPASKVTHWMPLPEPPQEVK